MQKVKTVEEALTYINDGMSLMIGGFLGVGTPDVMIDALVAKGTNNLEIICNDTSFVDKGIGKLIVSKQVRKVVTSHIGTNAETGRQMNAGEIEVVLSPQGTIAEQVRAAGAGLGGVITPTGIGTVVEEGKQKIVIDDKEFLVEKPLKADVALIRCNKADTKGNLYYDKAARNFNPLMAMAADFVIAEVDEIVEVGEIDPHLVHTPGLFVNVMVKGAKCNG